MESHQEKKKEPRTVEFRLDVLVHRGEGVFVGQCLQYDIAVQAPTVELLKERFSQAFAARLVEDIESGRDPLSTLQQAPRRFWDMYLRGAVTLEERPIYVPSTRKVARSDVRATFAQVAEATA